MKPITLKNVKINRTSRDFGGNTVTGVEEVDITLDADELVAQLGQNDKYTDLTVKQEAKKTVWDLKEGDYYYYLLDGEIICPIQYSKFKM